MKTKPTKINMENQKPNIDLLPGGWDCDIHWKFLPTLSSAQYWDRMSIGKVHNAISPRDCERIKLLFLRAPKKELVSVQGRKDIVDTEVGSKRVTMWNAELAKQVWEQIKDFIPNKICDEYTSTDWWQDNPCNKKTWIPVGCTPMLRIMEYNQGGRHNAHYDAGFIYDDSNYRTLSSVVVYLTTSQQHEGGATRFVKDKQQHINIWDRNHEDFITATDDSEVYLSSYPVIGDVLFFDHRKCHDVQEFTGDKRMIIRMDILYKSSDC